MARRNNPSPYFCEDGLLIDPRPIGKWSIRWCPAEEFERSQDGEVDPESLISQLGEQADIFEKWIALGMHLRFEAAVMREYARADAVYLFETTDPAVAARMVDEAGIIWWRSSIFEVDFDGEQIVFDRDAPETAEADGFENLTVKYRAHLIYGEGEGDGEINVNEILEAHGFDLITGAHGNWNWYVSPHDYTEDEMTNLWNAVMAAGDQIAHFDVSRANPHDITEGPMPPHPKRAKIKKPRREKSRLNVRRADAAKVFANENRWAENDVKMTLLDPRYAGVGDFPPIIEESTWKEVQTKLIADMGADAYVGALFDALKESFSGFADLLAAHIGNEPEGLVDQRSTEEIRAQYLQGKIDHHDNPVVVEFCNAGLALLDAEVALHDAPLGTRTKARAAVEAARQRMDAAGHALEAAGNVDFLRRWKSQGKPN